MPSADGTLPIEPPAGAADAAGGSAGLARAHSRLLEDSTLQFDRTGFTPPEVPAWLEAVRNALRALGPLMEYVFWGGLILIAAGLAGLPEAARPAFVRIGEVVERSLFGGRPVDAADFADCRRAYEAFALPEGWRA